MVSGPLHRAPRFGPTGSLKPTIVPKYAILIVLSLTLFSVAAAQDMPTLPPPPFWHFAVRSTDKSIVTIFFPKDWSPDGKSTTYSENQFKVQRSPDLESFDTLNGPYTDIGTAYAALDSGWSGNDAPYYQVVLSSAKGSEIATSTPLQPVDQAGNTFVVNGAAAPPGVTCGDLVSSPCPDLSSGINAVAPGSTLYVTPGIYSGAGNTNLTFKGKPFTLETTNGPLVTMINCTDPITGKKSRAFSFKSGEGRDSVLSGITVANGGADSGGCVSITDGAPIIRNSVFLMCNSTTGASKGGAIYVSSNPGPGPLVSGTSFILNWGNEGAAIYVGEGSTLEIENSSFEWGIAPTATGRGGAVCAVQANVKVVNTIMKNGIVGFAGGGILAERSSIVIDNLVAHNNSAGNFGGALLLFGADMKITNSQITENRGSIFAGGVILTSSVYEATDTIHNDNWARIGGGAIKVIGSQARLKNCQVNGNTAGYGAGFDISKQGDLSSMLTDVVVEDSEILDNAVTGNGAGFYLDAFDAFTFRNVIIKNNTAVKGGGGWCNADVPGIFDNVTFEENVAQMGGGMFADVPCKANMDSVVFRRNTAVQNGAGIATGDGVRLNITHSVFEANGFSNCTNSKPPAVGGGIMIGVEQFQINQQCGVQTQTNLTVVHIKNSSIIENLATGRGGGISLESGILDLDGVEVEGNRALGSVNGQGIGGGIAITERCPEGAPCSVAIARINHSTIADNSARSAGGGVHFEGSSSRGSLSIARSSVSSNIVEHEDTTENAQDGVGGGIFIGSSNFSVLDVNLVANEAFYGGGIFIAADLQHGGAKLARINATNNRAVLGAAAYWLRAKSPKVALPVPAFSITPDGSTSVATEVLSVNYSTPPPTVIQSGEEVSTFSVSLLDYYGNVGSSELGSCQVTAPQTTLAQMAAASEYAEAPAPGPASNLNDTPPSSPPAGGNDSITINPTGSEVGVGRGVAVFSQLQVTGIIGESYPLQVDCTPSNLGRSSYVQISGQQLPPLGLPVHIASCKPGKESKQTGSGAICVECPFNSYNFDGEECVECPKGAFCPGGDQLSSQKNWWRSYYNSTNFYSCRTPDVCNAGPVVGDAACVEGAEGPLCAVCQEDWFTFGGKCRSCQHSGLAKAMMAFAIILIVVVFVLIFAYNWDFGDPRKPGIMTKVKIVITHFQVLALFRDYDVLWPSATSQGFAWFDSLNVGMAMMAPECFYGSEYSFYVRWIYQMILPVGALALCVAIYYVADINLIRLECRYPASNATESIAAVPLTGDDSKRSASGVVSISVSTAAADNMVDASTPIRVTQPSKKIMVWLYELKIRCWKNSFWLVTLLYPRCSMTALQMFGTQTLDIGTFLTADYSIQVKPVGGGYNATYIRYMIPGAIMLTVFAVAIPAFWFLVIWRNRSKLEDEVVGKKYGFLYASYTRRFAYWETIESLRKFAFAFIPVFIPPNSVGSVQGTVGQIVACAYLVATVWLRPYAQSDDNDLQIASLAVLWLVLLSGCTAKWANLNDSGLKGLAVTQLILSSAVAFACAAGIAYSIVALIKRRKKKKAAKENNAGNVDDVAPSEDCKKSGRYSSFLALVGRAREEAPTGADNKQTRQVGCAGSLKLPQFCMRPTTNHTEQHKANVTSENAGDSVERVVRHDMA